MKLVYKKVLLIAILISTFQGEAQEGIPIYSDYLSDNLFLLHPSTAGLGLCGKARVTGRGQWFDQEDAPSLLTFSAHTRLGEKSGVGMIVYNDKNGYHSELGFQLAYAHHLDFSYGGGFLNQLSFGLSGGIVQSQLDQTNFNLGDFDPIITGNIDSYSYLNVDLGMSYLYGNFFAHATVKNLLLRFREIYTEDIETDNLRRYIFNAGYTFGDEFQIEPSVMFQIVDVTKENIIDANLKVYKEINPEARIALWGGFSYRRSLESEVLQELQYLTPFFGVNYKDFMFSYTFSQQSGDIQFSNGGFHQVTIGFNFSCRKERYHCNCPATNY